MPNGAASSDAGSSKIGSAETIHDKKKGLEIFQTLFCFLLLSDRCVAVTAT